MERRGEPRIPTSFLAAELSAGDVRYRLVRDVSEHGFSLVGGGGVNLGGAITMEFPLPGAREPVMVAGRVVRVDSGHLGVRIEHASANWGRLLSHPSPRR
jgi:hypothetical protein